MNSLIVEGILEKCGDGVFRIGGKDESALIERFEPFDGKTVRITFRNLEGEIEENFEGILHCDFVEYRHAQIPLLKQLFQINQRSIPLNQFQTRYIRIECNVI